MPNGDGNNDSFAPNYTVQPDMLFWGVYNKWGEVVFATKSLNGGWDGTFKSQPQTPGTYFYFSIYETKDGKLMDSKGSFLLIR